MIRMSRFAPSPPQTASQWVRLLGNVVNLSTPAGLLVALVGRSRIRRGPRGLVLADHYRPRFPVAGAFTVGNVVVTGQDWDALAERCPELLAHEEAHTWQYLVCLGLPYLPIYTACMAWSVLRTGDRASANVFERRAGLVTGGYCGQPVRPLGPVMLAQFQGLRQSGVRRRR